MRTLGLLLLAMATSTQAWEFTPGPPCLLTHDKGTAQIELTYDPTLPLYTLTVTRSAPWPDAPVFAMRFDGPQGRKIATDKHQLSPDGRSLSVQDRGFGNVLGGLQYNRAASAIVGDTQVLFPLDGAAEPVKKFRACDIPVS